MTTTSPSDLSDAEWECLHRYRPILPKRGRPRTHPIGAILNAMFYLLRTGRHWRSLSSNFPPWQTVFYHFRRWRLRGEWHGLFIALRVAERQRVGKGPYPSAAIMDAQSVKTVEESAHISGYNGHKHVKGRKRRLLVDTLGLPISIYVTPADMGDMQGARRLLVAQKYFLPRLKKIWADAAYRSKEVADWCKAEGDWELEVVERAPGMRGFSVLPQRWVVERTFGWLSKSRRMSKDYERKVQTSETLIAVAVIRLLIARLGWRPSGYSQPLPT